MKFDTLILLTHNLPHFDLPLITQLSGDKKQQLSQQLHGWSRQGKVIPLRRGLYRLSDTFCKAPLVLPQLANEIYRPSYLTGLWALAYFGMIPEKVTTFTSVTTRVTRAFKNTLGKFTYSSLKHDFFWGFTAVKIENTPVWIAEPEKALLDYWHLNHGLWSKDRLLEMRFQNLDQLNLNRLTSYAKKWRSQRLTKTVEQFKIICHESQKGYKTI